MQVEESLGGRVKYMDYEKEQLKKELESSKDSHRIDLFLIYLVIGEVLLGLIVGFDSWIFFVGAWIVVWLAWKLSVKQVR
jgi:hypothetical protein